MDGACTSLHPCRWNRSGYVTFQVNLEDVRTGESDLTRSYRQCRRPTRKRGIQVSLAYETLVSLPILARCAVWLMGQISFHHKQFLERRNLTSALTLACAYHVSSISPFARIVKRCVNERRRARRRGLRAVAIHEYTQRSLRLQGLMLCCFARPLRSLAKRIVRRYTLSYKALPIWRL